MKTTLCLIFFSFIIIICNCEYIDLNDDYNYSITVKDYCPSHHNYCLLVENLDLTDKDENVEFGYNSYVERVDNIEFKNCQIPTVQKGMFNKFKGIKEIIIDNCGIQTIEKQFISDLNYLNIINFNNNLIKKLNFLTFTDIGKSNKSLIELNLNNNLIETIEEYSFKNSYIFKINLESNRLIIINDKIFKGINNLTILNLSNNRIESIQANSFLNHNSFTDLYLNNNKLKIIEKNSFNGLRSLKILDLSNNSIGLIENSSFTEMISLELIDMHNNKLKSFNDIQIGYVARNSNKIDLSFNLLESVHFGMYHKLEILNLSSGNIKQIASNAFDGLDVKILILSNNQMEKFDMYVLYPIHYLKTLYIDGNQLTEINYENPKFLILNIKLTNNNWNCNYLKTMIEYSIRNNVRLIIDEKQTIQHAFGIGCIENDQQTEYKMEFFDNTTANDNDYNKINKNTISNQIVIIFLLCIVLVSVNIFNYTYYKNKCSRQNQIETMEDHVLIDISKK